MWKEGAGAPLWHLQLQIMEGRVGECGGSTNCKYVYAGGEMNCHILWESWGEPLPAFMAKYLRMPLKAKGSHKMCANFSSLKNNYHLNYQNFYNCNCTPQKIGLPKLGPFFGPLC